MPNYIFSRNVKIQVHTGVLIDIFYDFEYPDYSMTKYNYLNI